MRAVNDAGIAGSTATWSFTVLPPWYRTLPALIAFVLVLAAAVFGAFRWRLAFLKRQNVRLEILVQKKTEQLQKANEAKSGVPREHGPRDAQPDFRDPRVVARVSGDEARRAPAPDPRLDQQLRHASRDARR